MNKKTLWIGILVIVVLGLVVVGKHITAPAPAASRQDTAAPDAAADASADAAKTPATAAPAAKSKTPPKVAARSQSGIAATAAMPENVMLDLSTAFAQTYQLELERSINNPADFDKYYVVAKWSCHDAGCSSRAGVIDKRTGMAYMAPADNEQNKIPGPWFVPYTIDSNQYRIVNGNTIETYSFDGQHFTLVKVENF